MIRKIIRIDEEKCSGCGLCVLIEGTEDAARSWIIAGHTAALYQQSGEAWQCIASFPQKD